MSYFTCSLRVTVRLTLSLKFGLRPKLGPTVKSFLSRVSILTRDIDIANLPVRPSVRLSIRLSVTFRYQMKTA